MPWHLSKSDPRKVYDQTHGVVGVMQTAEQAALIVEAVNMRSTIRELIASSSCSDEDELALVDRQILARLKIAIQSKEKERTDLTQSNDAGEPGGGPASLTQLFQEDECCGKHLARFIRSGKSAEAPTWNCPSCGCEWQPMRIINGTSAGLMIHWTPVVIAGPL